MRMVKPAILSCLVFIGCQVGTGNPTFSVSSCEESSNTQPEKLGVRDLQEFQDQAKTQPGN